ncbi:hypothetical protein M3M35_07315 [Fructilactobacillus myrtifloralis]|uniref:DUF2977 domain-containing protein n=1 Tax=Fructilactobacillus myrtifloralis TaxID=2940301 RepID=A0ABY5BR87_9LACO|nr:hypothetical protein [Fructilactobacillus myrtifloralis]USS85091.1 hypothetical protein M3M35_07315 [Fructilactobacillus myrtifloralis]
MEFYVKIDDYGRMSNVSKTPFDKSTAVEVNDKYAPFFDNEHLSYFQWQNGEPISVAFPINVLSLEQKIMQEKLETLKSNDKDFSTNFDQVQGTTKFLMETVMNLVSEVKDLKAELKNQRSQSEQEDDKEGEK